MSMLSAQCDELRAMAESIGLAMPQAATLMMEAADTIWQLRDDLQQTNAKNAKLRELCGRELAIIENNCGSCAYYYDCNILNDCKCVAPKKMRDELRELGVEL